MGGGRQRKSSSLPGGDAVGGLLGDIVDGVADHGPTFGDVRGAFEAVSDQLNTGFGLYGGDGGSSQDALDPEVKAKFEWKAAVAQLYREAYGTLIPEALTAELDVLYQSPIYRNDPLEAAAILGEAAGESTIGEKISDRYNGTGGTTDPTAIEKALQDAFNLTPEQASQLIDEGGIEGALALLEDAQESSTGSGGGTGLTPAQLRAQEIELALLERELATNPNLQVVTDNRTGESYLLDTQTGERKSIGAFDFAGIDPEREFQEDQRQFDTSENRLLAGQENNFNIQRGQEDRLRRRLEFDVDSANQQTDVQRFDRLADVLRNPADFLSRAFLQRGQTSPSGTVTQADLLRALREEIRDIEDPAFESGLPSYVAPQPVLPRIPIATDPEPVGGTIGLTPEKIKDFYARGPQQESGSAPPAAPPAPEPRRRISVNPKQPPSRLVPYDEIPEEEFANFERGTNGPVREPVAVVGEKGPEILLNHGDGSFDVIPNDAIDDEKAKKLPGFEGGTSAVRKPKAGRLKVNPKSRLDTSQIDDQRSNGPTGFDYLRWRIERDRIAQMWRNGRAHVDRTQGEIPGLAGGTFGTQEEIIEAAKKFSPPAVNDLFTGNKTQGLDFDFDLFTPQQLARLTGDESTALNTRLAAQFNTTLEDVVTAQEQRFGRKRSGSRGRLRLD